MPALQHAQLSSIGDGIEDLARRSSELADRLEGESSSDVAGALYEAERSLRMAARAVERARRLLG